MHARVFGVHPPPVSLVLMCVAVEEQLGENELGVEEELSRRKRWRRRIGGGTHSCLHTTLTYLISLLISPLIAISLSIPLFTTASLPPSSPPLRSHVQNKNKQAFTHPSKHALLRRCSRAHLQLSSNDAGRHQFVASSYARAISCAQHPIPSPV